MVDLPDSLVWSLVSCTVAVAAGMILLWVVQPLLRGTDDHARPVCDCGGTGDCFLCSGCGAVPDAATCPECDGSGICHDCDAWKTKHEILA